MYNSRSVSKHLYVLNDDNLLANIFDVTSAFTLVRTASIPLIVLTDELVMLSK